LPEIIISLVRVRVESRLLAVTFLGLIFKRLVRRVCGLQLSWAWFLRDPWTRFSLLRIIVFLHC